MRRPDDDNKRAKVKAARVAVLDAAEDLSQSCDELVTELRNLREWLRDG